MLRNMFKFRSQDEIVVILTIIDLTSNIVCHCYIMYSFLGAYSLWMLALRKLKQQHVSYISNRPVVEQTFFGKSLRVLTVTLGE